MLFLPSRLNPLWPMNCHVMLVIDADWLLKQGHKHMSLEAPLQIVSQVAFVHQVRNHGGGLGFQDGFTIGRIERDHTGDPSRFATRIQGEVQVAHKVPCQACPAGASPSIELLNGRASFMTSFTHRKKPVIGVELMGGLPADVVDVVPMANFQVVELVPERRLMKGSHAKR